MDKRQQLLYLFYTLQSIYGISISRISGSKIYGEHNGEYYYSSQQNKGKIKADAEGKIPASGTSMCHRSIILKELRKICSFTLSWPWCKAVFAPFKYNRQYPENEYEQNQLIGY